MMRTISLLLLCAATVFCACAPEAVVPTDATAAQDELRLFPQYADIVVPPNIAPLNVQVQNEADAYVCAITPEGAQEPALVVGAGSDGKCLFPETEWHALLDASRGKALQVAMYAQRDGEWQSFPTYQISVAEEPIDSFLSYRLIEPSYELYRQLGLYQRNLTNFDVHTIYENNRTRNEDNHCVNCHNYQNYSTDRMLFHIRAAHGGTVVVQGDHAEKVNIKNDSILSGAVYPTWHPTKPWVVFSSNLTGQVFHIRDLQKIEVVDYGSDLIFYDAEKHTVKNILRTRDDFETFPCFTPDGSRVYYCSARADSLSGISDSLRRAYIQHYTRDMHYDLYSMSFDAATQIFGEPTLEYRAEERVGDSLVRRSVAVPRVSPDGRYVLFTQGEYGQFHVWHKSADLYVLDTQTHEVRLLTEASLDDAQDSYHSWSSNGRWFVFSSRRDDGSYTRPYIAYFDREGKDHKAFLLPQADPEQNLLLMKSYNVPELSRNAVRLSAEELKKIVYDDDRTMQVELVP